MSVSRCTGRKESGMKVLLRTFPDCPNAISARDAPHAAIRAEHLEVVGEELDFGRDDAPPSLRAWGSPTILIDGADVTGAPARDGEVGCRLYAGGSPSVAQIRDALSGERRGTRGGAGWPLVGAIIAAVAASACCEVPAMLAQVGHSGAGIAAAMAPARPYLLAATAVALAAGFWLAYRRSPRAADACGCAIPRRRRWTRVGLWFGVALVVGIAAYPSLVGSNSVALGEARSGVAEIRLLVGGMDCRACTKAIARKLATEPGVV